MTRYHIPDDLVAELERYGWFRVPDEDDPDYGTFGFIFNDDQDTITRYDLDDLNELVEECRDARE